MNAGGYEARSAFFYRQYEKYGTPFLDWWDKIAVPAKEKFDR